MNLVASTRFPNVSLATRKAMQGNKGKDTKPEMIVRRLVHGMGYRYRLHRKDLPGKPDLAFGPKRKAIFVHGCFWHAHEDPTCKVCGAPKTRADYWQAKFDRNKTRDARNVALLGSMGWTVLTLWECEMKDLDAVRRRVSAFLE